MTKDSIPLYGIIAYTGNQWSITFKEELYKNSSVTSTLSGYGTFPFDRYPGVPVINFNGAEKVIESLSISREFRPKEESGINSGTLETYLNELIKLDIPIIRIRDSFENNYKL